MEGHIVLQEQELVGKQRIDVSDLVSGLYSVEFVPNDNKERVVYTFKLIKN